jgi:hypothetical protein
MKYRVLTETLEDGNRHYIQDIEDNSILYETATKWQAEQICVEWNKNSIAQRKDGTLDLTFLDTPSL